MSRITTNDIRAALAARQPAPHLAVFVLDAGRCTDRAGAVVPLATARAAVAAGRGLLIEIVEPKQQADE